MIKVNSNVSSKNDNPKYVTGCVEYDLKISVKIENSASKTVNNLKLSKPQYMIRLSSSSVHVV